MVVDVAMRDLLSLSRDDTPGHSGAVFVRFNAPSPSWGRRLWDRNYFGFDNHRDCRGDCWGDAWRYC